MRQLSIATRRELTAAVGQRYTEASRAEKVQILDEFVVVTGFHRKHAMRLLRGDIGQSSVRRTRRRIYEEAERNALVVLWEAWDRICSKRLKALLPLLIESRDGTATWAWRLKSAKPLAMSASTIDGALGKIRQEGGRQRRRPVASALRRSIPVRTSADWKDRAPGFVEADLVAQSGLSARGNFYPDAGAHRYCYRLDGVCGVAGARAKAPEHRVDRTSPIAAVFAPGHRYRE